MVVVVEVVVAEGSLESGTSTVGSRSEDAWAEADDQARESIVEIPSVQVSQSVGLLSMKGEIISYPREFTRAWSLLRGSSAPNKALLVANAIVFRIQPYKLSSSVS
jgi:hypothetical protein